MTHSQSTVGGRPCHPACLLLPEMTPDEYRELFEDIREQGQRRPIVVDAEGQILDGRHRDRACAELGIAPKVETFHGTEEAKIALIMSENIKRRHLTVQQRAAVAAELAEKLAEAAKARQWSGTQASPEAKGKTAEQAAKMVGGVSRASVQRAIQRKKTDPAAHALAKTGKLRKATPKPAQPAGAPFVDRHGFVPRPPVEPSLSATAQQKLDAHKRRLRREFEDRVRQASMQWLEERRIPDLEKKLKEHERMLSWPRNSVMRKDEYNTILGCLHPDSGSTRTPEQLAEAFRIFTHYKLKMVNDEEERREAMRKLRSTLPRTVEEMLARRKTKPTKPAEHGRSRKLASVTIDGREIAPGSMTEDGQRVVELVEDPDGTRGCT